MPPPTFELLVGVYSRIYWIGPSESVERWRSVAILLMIGAVVGGFAFHLWMARFAKIPADVSRSDGSSDGEMPWRGSLLLALFLLPSIATYLVSIWGYPLFLADRYTLPFLPAFILWVVAGWGSWPGRAGKWLPAVGLVACVVVGSQSIRTYWDRHQLFDWRRTIKIVEESWRADDIMVFSPFWLRTSYDFNGGHSRNVVPANRPALLERADRMWLVMWEYSPRESERRVLTKIREGHNSETFVNNGNQTMTLVWMHEPKAAEDAETGFHVAENWDGETVRWTKKAALIPLVSNPGAVPIRYWIGHPDVSPESPVEVEMFVNGESIWTASHESGGFYTHDLTMPDADGTEMILRIEVDRTWVSPEGRHLGIGLYWDEWISRDWEVWISRGGATF